MCACVCMCVYVCVCVRACVRTFRVNLVRALHRQNTRSITIRRETVFLVLRGLSKRENDPLTWSGLSHVSDDICHFKISTHKHVYIYI